MEKILCIYHGNCADGFGAAWVVRKALGEGVEFYPGVYQQEPPDVTGRYVLFVDFSYKRPVLDKMMESAESILILDHHKTAADDLADLPTVGSFGDWVSPMGERPPEGYPLMLAVFDMARSGAGLTWDFFFPNEPRPALIQHIEDRDLWKFDLTGTREIQANIFSHPYDFDVWDKLIDADPEALRAEGEAIERKHHKDVAELVKVCQRRMVIGGVDVPAASLPYTLVSDAAHEMGKGEPFAACYWDTADARIFGLRSSEDGADVSAIALQYGGGGHKHAAGFSVPRNHKLAQS